MSLIKSLVRTRTKATSFILKKDYSPLDRVVNSRAVVRHVNAVLGIKGGGNIKIANGEVLYPSDQNDRRRRVLSIGSSLY